MAWRETERQERSRGGGGSGRQGGGVELEVAGWGVTLSVRRAWRGHAVGEDRASRWGEGRESPCAAIAQDVFFLSLFPFLPPSLIAASGGCGGSAEPVSPLARLTSD